MLKKIVFSLFLSLTIAQGAEVDYNLVFKDSLLRIQNILRTRGIELRNITITHVESGPHYTAGFLELDLGRHYKPLRIQVNLAVKQKLIPGPIWEGSVLGKYPQAFLNYILFLPEGSRNTMQGIGTLRVEVQKHLTEAIAMREAIGNPKLHGSYLKLQVQEVRTRLNLALDSLTPDKANPASLKMRVPFPEGLGNQLIEVAARYELIKVAIKHIEDRIAHERDKTDLSTKGALAQKVMIEKLLVERGKYVYAQNLLRQLCSLGPGPTLKASGVENGVEFLEERALGERISDLQKLHDTLGKIKVIQERNHFPQHPYGKEADLYREYLKLAVHLITELQKRGMPFFPNLMAMGFGPEIFDLQKQVYGPTLEALDAPRPGLSPMFHGPLTSELILKLSESMARLEVELKNMHDIKDAQAGAKGQTYVEAVDHIQRLGMELSVLGGQLSGAIRLSQQAHNIRPK